MAKTPTPPVVVPFKPRSGWLGARPIQLVHPAGADAMTHLPAAADGIDLSGKPRLVFLFGPGSSGKTMLARWIVWRMAQSGRSALLAALDPGTRALATWIDDVAQPPDYNTVNSARWLGQLLDHLATNPQTALLDFGGGGETIFEAAARGADLVSVLETAGIGAVMLCMLTPRIDDLLTVDRLLRQFHPKAVGLLLNTGRGDPNIPPEESFDPVTGHPLYTGAINQGAVPIWLPTLAADVMQEIETRRLTFGEARDGQVPAGDTLPPIGGLRRSMVSHWLANMERATAPIASWLP
jgi:hypothetical protein